MTTTKSIAGGASPLSEGLDRQFCSPHPGGGRYHDERLFRDCGGNHAILLRDEVRARYMAEYGPIDGLSMTISQLVRSEVNVIVSVMPIKNGLRLAFIGAGAACDSLIAFSLALNGVICTGFENRPEAVTLANINFLKYGSGRGRIICATGSSADYSAFDVIVVASYVGAKGSVLRAIEKTAGVGAVVAIRSSLSGGIGQDDCYRRGQIVSVAFNTELDVMTRVYR